MYLEVCSISLVIASLNNEYGKNNGLAGTLDCRDKVTLFWKMQG